MSDLDKDTPHRPAGAVNQNSTTFFDTCTIEHLYGCLGNQCEGCCFDMSHVLPCEPPQRGDPDCPVRGILDRLGDKWSTLVISNLAEGRLRFSEIKKRIPDISQRMLTETLRTLERDGVLLRSVYPSIPPRVEYSLTPLGHSLLPLVMALVSWALEHRSEIRDARASYDAAKSLPLEPVAAVQQR